MKITAIRPITVHAGDRNWVFVRVETDQPGLYGWGEGILEWKTRAVVGSVEDFVPMLLGRDPRDISWLHERMVKHSFWPLAVAMPNFVTLGQLSDRIGHFSAVADVPITLRDGCWEIPDRPGLGVEIDMAEAAKYPFEQESIAARDAIHERDGSIAHW